MLQHTPTATPTPTGATFTPTYTATPGGTPLATHAPTVTPTPWILICPGLPVTGTGTLKNSSGVVLETVVYTSSAGKSFGAVNWATPPADGRTWATGTPNPGTAGTLTP